ncbi:MAG: UDP-N-acetylmuramate dehydrogenase, partial [Treponema sp.]|nr:UDP-N-acetylmuramate dehydrogenase [Treponema sp.]
MNSSIRQLSENFNNSNNAESGDSAATPALKILTEKFKSSPLLKDCTFTDADLTERTTMKIASRAALFVSPETEEGAAFVISECKKMNARCFFLGGGSNLVTADGTLNFVILSTENMKEISLKEENGSFFLTALAGTPVSDITDFCIQNGLSGFEKFGGLPGSIGSSCFMNARCYEKNMSSLIEEIEYIDCSGKPCVYKKDESDWDYKSSPFQKNGAFITRVTLTGFTKSDSTLIKKESDSYVEDRRNKGHFKFPSAGSVFKNNRSFGKPSGALVDQAGLQGTECGGAQIAPWHGNFIINKGSATANDIKSLVKLAQDKVREQTGFSLECEIIFV